MFTSFILHLFVTKTKQNKTKSTHIKRMRKQATDLVGCNICQIYLIRIVIQHRYRTLKIQQSENEQTDFKKQVKDLNRQITRDYVQMENKQMKDVPHHMSSGKCKGK